jgi:serine/threonine protein phosphatase 1
MRFKALSLNKFGRDFVIGDIHGAFDLVIKAMREVSFDERCDRLFCTGDLIDRGEGSIRALKFLEKPYVYCISGNHDKDFSELNFESMQMLAEMNWNGMGWAKNESREKLLRLAKKLSELPVAMEVQTRRGRGAMSWNDFVANIKAGDVRTTEIALRGRNRVGASDKSGVSGIDRVFVGHSIQWDGVKQLGNVYLIDTGATFRQIDGDRGFATIVNLNCMTGVLGNPAEMVASDGIIALNKEGGGMFGSSAWDF